MIGVSPEVLVEQVRGTAAWALDGPDTDETSFRRALSSLDDAIRAHTSDPPGLAYFRLLLAAHFCTVATFVPTDVDARIRHHTFVTMSADDLAAALDILDEATRWDARLVSARVVELDDRNLSGHDGEWLSVRAGALGRAIALGKGALVSRITTAIEEELLREHRILESLARTDVIAWLRAATTVAHNLGDLSRVVEAWPNRPEYAVAGSAYARLGHTGATRFGATFVQAGTVNKALLADENHRFLALRKPRALRGSRDLLLPIGPFFYDWGRVVARHSMVSDEDRGEITAALLAVHLAKPASRGCLRALAGIDAHAQGGLARLAPLLPARMRKLLSSGPIRDALKTREEAFIARLRNLVALNARA